MGIIVMERQDLLGTMEPGEDNSRQHKAARDNPYWRRFIEYCELNAIVSIKELRDVPSWLQEMLGDNLWRPKMGTHLRYWRAGCAST